MNKKSLGQSSFLWIISILSAALVLFLIIESRDLRGAELVPPTGQTIGQLGPVVLQFDDEMERESVEARFKIDPMVPGSFQWLGDRLFFYPSIPLEAGTNYTLFLESGSRLTAGGLLPKDQKWQFSIRYGEIAYLFPVSGQPQIWISDHTGKQKSELTGHSNEVADFSVSRDGLKIVYSLKNQEGGFNIWGIKRTGESLGMLADCGRDWCLESALSPDGRLVVYSRASGSSPAGKEIVFLDTETGSAIGSPTGSSLYGSQPGWSPDGSTLTYHDAQRGGIILLGWETGEEIFLFNMEKEPGSWSLDGNIFAYTVLVSMDLQAVNQIVLANLVTRRLEPVRLEGNEPTLFRNPRVAPGGERLAVLTRNPAGGLNQQLSVITLADGKIELINPDESYFHTLGDWSPDGDKLLYQRYTPASSLSSPEVLLWDKTLEQVFLVASDASQAAWLP